MALVVMLLGVGGLQQPATARSFSATVQGTGGAGLFVRPGPSASSGAPKATLAEGRKVTIACYKRGQTVAGYWYTGNLWHKITSPVNGWISDTYVYTGHNRPIPGEKKCGSGGSADRQLDRTYTNQCNGRYVRSVTIEARASQTIARIDPTTTGRYLSRVHADRARREARACGMPAAETFASQFVCHAVGSVGAAGRYTGGERWDLEGSRPANWSVVDWVKHKCNW